MQNYKVLLLEGGYNEEHQVSISTGKEVKKSLRNLNIAFTSLIVNPKTFKEDLDSYDNSHICFNALHGSFGEDGSIQKILNEKNFKYTHSNAKTSYIGFNKDLTKKELHKTSLFHPKYLNLNFCDLNKNNLIGILNEMGEFIIKPNCSGSSFGIKIFKNLEDINNFVNDLVNNLKIYQNHNNIIVEEYLNGRELTVGVVEKNRESYSLEVTEIIASNNNYFDYISKYTPGAAKHFLPANLKKTIYQDCKNFAKIAHDVLNCRGVSRTDFILVDEKIFFLEINTQPGLTPISLVPEQLKFQNISFDDLILDILECA